MNILEQKIRDKIMIQVDGGIKLDNFKDVLTAGGDILVAGSEVFNLKILFKQLI